MIELKTLSKPRPSNRRAGLESVTAPNMPARKATSGSTGSASGETSRAADEFLVIGKSEQPTSRSRTVISHPSGLESVIETDDRQRILETELAPWRMITALRMFSTSGAAAIGTGWLAGPKTIVTAGHCVHHQDFFDGWADRIEVSAGRNGSDFPFETISAVRFSSVDRWVNSADPDFDIGCIHLDEPLGKSVGWFGFAHVPPQELATHQVNVVGYPGDRGAGTELYHHANRVLHVGSRRVFYDTDTAAGQSGGPVWIHESNSAEPLVVAIHAYGTGGTPFDLGITANSAPRIIPEVFDQIQSWIEADSAEEAAVA